MILGTFLKNRAGAGRREQGAGSREQGRAGSRLGYTLLYTPGYCTSRYTPLSPSPRVHLTASLRYMAPSRTWPGVPVQGSGLSLSGKFWVTGL